MDRKSEADFEVYMARLHKFLDEYVAKYGRGQVQVYFTPAVGTGRRGGTHAMGLGGFDVRPEEKKES